MMAKHRFLLFSVLLFSLICSVTYAQQIYHGDGATNNGSGAWTTSTAAPGQCLTCHAAQGNFSTYMASGHKNVLRKVTPGSPWNDASGNGYATTDTTDNYIYGSGSTYNWATGKVTVGPSTTSTAFGPIVDAIPGNDSNGTYSFFGLPQPLYYQFGGWADKTQLDTIFANGFTGELFPNGNYDCARCHTTGYRFDSTDATATEPKDYLGNSIPAANFSRVPTDYDPATGPNASWHMDGVQCERCHNADNGTYNHTAGGVMRGGIPTKPVNQGVTALCMNCHREETADTTANTITPGNGDSATLGANYSYIFTGGGYCSDSTSLTAADCQTAGGTWGTPWFDHESGPTFLNSPHARFSGTVTTNNQNSPDLSLTLAGSYNSNFKDSADLTKNAGCAGCHNVHQSTVTSSTPFVKNCTDCHSGHGSQTIQHPTGTGTPFPNGTAVDTNSCVLCHASQNYHLFRISTDPSYSTFPTPAELYAGNNLPHTVSDGKLTNAVWSDIDLACGQCHVGGDGITNPYGLTSSGATPHTKAYLATAAVNMHTQPPAAAKPTFSPQPGTFGTTQSVTLSDTAVGAAIYYTLDGSTPTASSTAYAGPISVSATTTIKAIAVPSGYNTNSTVASGTYTIPTPVPSLSPYPWSYTSPQSVTLSDTKAGVNIYYTTDGTAPTTASTPYTGAIPVSTTTTIKAIAGGNGYSTSPVVSGTYTLAAKAPTFSPSPWTYYSPQSVTLADASSGANVYYTTNGTTPTTASTPYTGAIAVSTTTTIKAIAVGGGYTGSTVASATYSITAKAPTLSPSPWSYNSPQSVTLADASTGATIYYTTNGTTPTMASIAYTGPIAVSTTTTIKSIAVGGGYGASTVASGTYTIH